MKETIILIAITVLILTVLPVCVWMIGELFDAYSRYFMWMVSP